MTLARRLAILLAMRDAFRTVAVLQSALSTRRDLLLEILALRHQLGVLGRSDRRFRPPDRLLWVCLRRWWPRWREALVLVQPATVGRWHREGFRGCWRRRSRRRPGRPRIDLQLRSLIARMATENPMTTSTPPFCGAALFRRHATAVTLPLAGNVSLRPLRANRRLLTGVSHRINFTAVHVYVAALARTRRSLSSNLYRRRTAGGSLRPETPSRPKELISSLRRNPSVALCAFRSSTSLASRQRLRSRR